VRKILAVWMAGEGVIWVRRSRPLLGFFPAPEIAVGGVGKGKRRRKK